MDTVEQSPTPQEVQPPDPVESEPPQPQMSGPIRNIARCYRFEPPPELLGECEQKTVNAWEPVRMKRFPDVPDDPKVKKLVEDAVAQNGYAPFSQERQLDVMSALRTYGSPYVPPSFGLNPWSEVMRERGDDEVADYHWTGGFGTGARVLTNYRASNNRPPPPSADEVGSRTPIIELMYRSPTVDPTVIRYEGERYAKWNRRPEPPPGPPPGVTITGKYMSLLANRCGPRSIPKPDVVVDEPTKKFPLPTQPDSDAYVSKPFGSVYCGAGGGGTQSGGRLDNLTGRPPGFGSTYRGGGGNRGGSTYGNRGRDDRFAGVQSTCSRPLIEPKDASADGGTFTPMPFGSTYRGGGTRDCGRPPREVGDGNRFEQPRRFGGRSPTHRGGSTYGNRGRDDRFAGVQSTCSRPLIEPKDASADGGTFTPMPFGSTYRGGGTRDCGRPPREVGDGNRFEQPRRFGGRSPTHRGGSTYGNRGRDDRFAGVQSTCSRPLIEPKDASADGGTFTPMPFGSTYRGGGTRDCGRPPREVGDGNRFEQPRRFGGRSPTHRVYDLDSPPRSNTTENLDKIETLGLFQPPRYPERVPEILKRPAQKLPAFEPPPIDSGDPSDITEETQPPPAYGEKSVDDGRSISKPEDEKPYAMTKSPPAYGEKSVDDGRSISKPEDEKPYAITKSPPPRTVQSVIIEQEVSMAPAPGAIDRAIAALRLGGYSMPGVKQGLPRMSADDLRALANEKLGEYTFDPTKYMGRVMGRGSPCTTRHGRKVVRRELKQRAIRYFADPHEWDDYLHD